MRQWVTVHIEPEEGSPDAQFDRKGNVIVTFPRAVDTVTVYGPFKTEREARRDAAQLKAVGGMVFVREITEVTDEMKG